MRHKKAGRTLGRNGEHRRAMFRNMTRALLTHESIKTTEAKAKELRGLAEKMITLGLKEDLHSRRIAYKWLENHQLVQKLFDEIAPRYKGAATGGYTRVVKLAMARRGDAAPLAVIELTRKAGEAAGAAEAPKATEE